MKNITIALLLLLATACSQNKQAAVKVKADTISKKTTGIQYTCPMHPSFITNKPGTCPKCGMELVEKDDSK
jgi:transcription initiation factor IIE alpha subunit